MPQLTWQIDVADQQILADLTKIEQAADRAAAAVKGIGTGAGGINQVASATTGAAKAAEQASGHFATLSSRIVAIGAGLAIYKGFSLLESSISNLVQSVIQLPAAFEQAQIGFTAMLDGNRQAADQMLTQIQQLANVTPFKFDQEQQAARTLLGLGQTAEKILPELVDIDTAVAAVGGNEQQVQRVAQALGKMSAEGRVSAIFMNELTRDGIPAWRMLAEELGVSVAKVRELSESGDLAASTFEKAFHDYTVKHWGDALSAQSQTFNGLVSTAQDLFEQFTRVFGMPIIQTLEPKLRGALQAMQDPKVLATIEQWGQGAATFVGWLFEAVGAVGQLLGLPTPEIGKGMADASDAVKQFAGDWSQVGSDTGPIANTKQQIAGINREIRQAEIDLRNTNRAAEETELTYKHQSDAISEQIRLLDAKYERENRATTIAELQRKINEDAQKADPYTAQGQAASKRLIDERAQLARALRENQHADDKAALEDQKRGIDDRAQTFREGAQKHARDVQDQIDTLRQKVLDLQNAGTGGTDPKPNVRIAGDDIADRYAQAIGAGLDKQAPSLLDRLFGTPDDQQKAGQALADHVTAGINISVTDWAAGHGSMLMNILMGGTSLENAWDNWLGQVGGLEDLGGKLAKAMFPDWPGLIPWLDQQMKGMNNGQGPSKEGGVLGDAIGASSEQKLQAGAGGPPHMADPNRPGWVDVGPTPGNWRYLPGEWEQLTGRKVRTTKEAYDTPYTSYNGTYSGGRAGGGPVLPGRSYTVGEYGAETLYMGAHGGYVAPTTSLPVQQGMGEQHLTITVRTERGEVIEIVRAAVDQQVTGKLVAGGLGSWASR